MIGRKRTEIPLEGKGLPWLLDGSYRVENLFSNEGFTKGNFHLFNKLILNHNSIRLLEVDRVCGFELVFANMAEKLVNLLFILLG